MNIETDRQAGREGEIQVARQVEIGRQTDKERQASRLVQTDRQVGGNPAGKEAWSWKVGRYTLIGNGQWMALVSYHSTDCISSKELMRTGV